MKRNSVYSFAGCFAITITAASLVMAQPPRRGPGGPPRDGQRPPFPLVDAIDTNRDKVISADEIKAASEAMLMLDKNGDGQLSEDEFAPLPPREGGRPGRGGPDGRGPGGPLQPSPDRFIEHAMQFDKDGDGKLDRDELMSFAMDMPNHRPGVGGPDDERGPRDRRPGPRGDRPRRPDAE